ncbi:TlpA disulfide reductase family protein [Micromonospora sp. M12]
MDAVSLRPSPCLLRHPPEGRRRYPGRSPSTWRCARCPAPPGRAGVHRRADRRHPFVAAELWEQRPVVLTFFSSWCTTCAGRQAALSELARSYRDRVVFVGVAGADQADEVQEYLRAHRVEYPVVLDDQQTIWRSYAVREPPAVVLVAKGGALLRGWPGGLDAPTLDRQLRELVLAGQP